MAPPEQLLYARWLLWGARAGLAALIAAFAAYAGGVVPAQVPLEALPGLWHLPVDEFLDATRTSSGWAWLRWPLTGEDLNMAGVALLGLATLACYLRILLLHLRQEDYVAAGLTGAQIAVLAAAASGLVAGSH